MRPWGSPSRARGARRPSSHFLSPSQYYARFGTTADAVTQVKSWLTSAGLKVTGVEAHNRYVSISGTVFDDTNLNGVRDVTEVGRSGIVVNLDLNNDGTADLQATTDANGNYQFTHVPDAAS